MIQIMEKEEEAKVKVIQAQAGGQARLCQSNADVIFFGGNLGGGKENPLSTDILTPTGWVKMGKVKIGDIICTPFGKPTTITGIYPQGVKSIYELKTSDGRIGECGLEHLWEVRTKKQIHKYRKHLKNDNFFVWTTEKIIAEIKRGISLYIPTPHAQEFEEKEFAIPPYLLGVLIGDGCLTASDFKDGDNCFKISSNEQDIIDKIALLSESERVRDYHGNFTKCFYTKETPKYRKYIKEVGLNTYSYNKFIPNEYLWGSIEQRMELLYGLMDTDGCVEDRNVYSFSTTSEQLSKDLVYLCRSLGYTATIRLDKREDKYTNGVAYRIGVQTNDVIFTSVKHLSRHKNNIHKYPRKYSRTNDHVLIESINYKGEEEAQCIYVEDKDHLYIIDDFLTTHNTFGAALAIAEATTDKNFRGVFFRKNLGDTKTAGGLTDTFKECYGDYCSIKMSDTPKISFASGAQVELRHCAIEEPQKIIEIYKGLQADVIYFDELTSFSFHTFTYLMTRNRGKAKWSGHTIASLNPKKNHWVREFLKNHIGADGFIRPDMDGKIVYFYLKGSTVRDVVWGDTKREVYEQCKIDIDRKLKNFDSEYSYENMVRSFVFILGTLAQNKAMLANNKNYIGAVASSGNMSRALIEGNWDWMETDEEAPIPNDAANEVFFNDPQVNGDKWITADLADYGNDNLVIIAWDALHIIDIMIIGQSTPRQNAERIQLMAERHKVGDDHIIYDATAARYINDYIPDAVPYIARSQPVGLYGRMAFILKDECYQRLVQMICKGLISCEEEVALRPYVHIKLKQEITVQTEFLEECSVVRFKEIGSGKKRLMNKKEMNQMLGKGRSMDLLDACAMRMYPILQYELGSELENTMPEYVEEETDVFGRRSIYDNSTWA